MSLNLSPILIYLVTVKIILGNYTLTKSETYVFSGSSITFTCNAGTVVKSVQWMTPDLDFPVSQGSGTSCTGTPPPDYQYSCSVGTVFNLTVNNINFGCNGTAWRCGPAFGGTPSNTEYCEVHVPLENISITNRSTPIKAGILTQLTCSTNPCYPEAVITWTLDGSKITDGITSSPGIINGSGVVTTSHLNKTFNTEDNGKSLVCSAINGEYHVSSNITLDIQAEERNSTNVPTTTPNLGSGSSCNLVCIILITVISVTGLCIIIVCCLISLRNQSTQKTNKTENVELGSETSIEKTETEAANFIDGKAEGNSNIQENTDKKHNTENVESSHSVSESSPSMSGNQGSNEEYERSEDYSDNQTSANQPVSNDVSEEHTRSEVCQQSVTDSLNETDDTSDSTTVNKHPVRQNHKDVDYHIEQDSGKRVTFINVTKNKQTEQFQI